MSDLTLTLRIKTDADGTIRAVQQVNKEVGGLGPQAQKSGREAEQGMGRARRGVESISNSLDRMQRIAATAFAGLVSFRAVERVFSSIVSNTTQQEAVLAQLEARIRSTGGAAGRSMEQLTELSRELQNTTAFANEDIERMMGTLLTFANIAGDQFDASSRAILNIATAMGTDLQSAALQVGKALNDPIRGMDGLNRSGIQFSDTQREIIKNMAETGDVAGAQRLILQELETQFGGAAEAARGTFGGALSGLRNAFDDLLKFQGDLPTLTAQIEAITNRLLDPAVADAIQSGLGAALALIPPAISAAVLGLESFVAVVTVVVENVDLLIDGVILLATLITARLVAALVAKTAATLASAGSLSLLNIALLAATIQTQALAVASRTATAAFALMGGPIGVVALALAGLVIAARRWQAQVAEIGSLAGPTGDAIERLRAAASGEWDASSVREYRDALEGLNATLEQQQEELDKLARRRELFAAALFSPALFSDTVRGWIGLDDTEAEQAARARIALAEQERQALDEVNQAREWVAQQFGSQAERYATGSQKIAEWSETAVGWLERYGLVTRNAAGGIGAMAAASDEIIGPLDAQVEQLRQQVFLLTHGEAAMVDYMEAQALARAALQDVSDGTTANVEATQRYFQTIRTLTEEERRLRQEQENRTKAAQQATAAQAAMQVRANGVASAYQQLLAQLQPVRAEQERLTALLAEATQGGEEWQRMLEAAGLTAAQAAELVDLIAQALDDLDIDGTKALEESLEGLRRAADPAYEVAALLAEELAELQKIADAGLIDETEFERLSAWLKAAYDDAMSLAEAFDIMAGAAGATLRAVQQFAGQGSKEFQALEIAINALALVQGISAILNQGQGDPYSAPVRMAMMAAAIAPLIANLAGSIGNFGGSGGGFSDTAGQRQASQGTGSVLGDAEAKSESILRASEITADATRELVGINRGMLRALINLNNALASAGNLLARGAGGAEFDIDPGFIFNNVQDAVGGLLGSLLDPLGLAGSLLGGKSKITDEGILIVGGTIGQMIEEVMVGAYQEVQSRSWRFGRQRTRTGVGDLDDQVVSQFQLVFEALADTVFEGAIALGLSADAVEEAINSFIVPETFISLKDLTGEEQQKAIEAVFGQIFDNLAGAVVPWISQFQMVGEALGETLVRVATGVQVMHEAIRRLGFSLDETDPEKFAQASEGLIGLMGGLDEFISGLVNFFDKFADEATRFGTAQGDLERAFDQVGLALPATRDAMWELMQSLDATTESGREQIAMLLELTDVADAYYSYLESIENERLGLERRILQLQGDTVALRQLELEKLDESNRELQRRIWALEEEIELADILAQAGDEIARLSMSPLRFEFRQLSIAQRELTARVRELTESEEHLGLIRMRQDLENQALAERAMNRLRAIQEQLWGAGSGVDSGPDFTPIDNAALRVRDSLIRALESVAEWVRRSSFMDPSLRPVDQMSAMQAEFDRLMNIALTGSGQEQADAIAALPQLASQMEALGAQVWGTATAEFQDFRAGLVDAMENLLDSIVPPPEPDPVTGSQVAGIAGAIDQVVLSLGEQKLLAAEALEVLGVIRALTGESPLEIAREFGVPLRDAIELLIGELGEGTAETIEQLAHIANTLGVNLTELADELGLNIGELIDHESLLSQALRDVIDGLPAGIQDELLEPLMRIWSATNEADANEALSELLELTDELPAWIRNMLAPYFEEIDPVDYLLEQVGLLEQMREYERRQAEAAETSSGLLAQLLTTLRDANSFADVPGYATGGWVNSNQIIRAGEAGRELILPNPVSEFFAREGIPVRVGGGSGSSADSVAELRRIAQLIEDGNRDRRDVANEQIVVVTDLRTEMAGINQSISREGVGAWPQRR